MRTRTDILLTVMNVLAWITFIGLMIKAGAFLVSYVVSVVNPEGSKNVYNGLNLYDLRQFSFWHYTYSISFMVALLILESYTAYLVIKVLSKIKMANPFKIEISRNLEKISYYIFCIWVLVELYDAHIKWLMKKVPGLEENLISGEFIFLAGIIFVFSQIFKKGVEIQSENELTV